MKLRLLALCSVATCALIVACSGDDSESTPAGGGAAASAPATPPPEGTTAPTSPSSTKNEEDAGLITEGGGDPDEESDAGVVADAGADGGTCGPAAGNGPAVASSCSSKIMINAGGTITPGTYDLAGFTLTGSAEFCSTYKASSYSGRLDVTADGKGGFILGERAVKMSGFSFLPNKSFSATLGSSVLKVVQTCGPAIKAISFGYSVTTTDGKPTILYAHDSGTATVRYRWIMR